MEKADVAKVGTEIYEVIMSAPSFDNVHKQLLHDFVPFLQKSSKRLLVIGPGPNGNPYYKIPEKFKKIFLGKDYKVVFLDYSVKVISECFDIYKKLGIIGDNGLKSQIVVNDNNAKAYILKNADVDKDMVKIASEDFNLEGKLTFFQHDLQEKLPDLGKFDIVESGFTLHHIAQYKEVLEQRLKEIHSLLDKGGLFYWTTGLCKMDYSEKKIKRIGRKCAKYIQSQITIIDKRNKEKSFKLSFKPDGKYKIEAGSDKFDYKTIHIDDKGLVHVPVTMHESCKIKNATRNKNYFIFPLIDAKEKSDNEGLVKHVRKFYAPTRKEILALDEYPKELVQKAAEEDAKEETNAAKGLVEYYQAENIILKLLSKAGFRTEIKRPNKDFKDLVNIVSVVS